MANFLQIARSVIYVLILALIALGIIWNLPALDRAVRNLLDQAAAISAIELFGVKLSFSTSTVYEFLNFEHLEPVDKDRIHGKLYGLTPQEFERLMNIGELEDLCVFEAANADMKDALATDHALRDRGLTEITGNPEAFERVHARFTRLASQNQLPDIGLPLTCYDLKLTEDGYNAKTVLTKTLSQKFREKAGSR